MLNAVLQSSVSWVSVLTLQASNKPEYVALI